MSHGHNLQTIITYTGGTPTLAGTVTLFNSITAFPPGGSFHLLGQQWFQYSLRVASVAGAGGGTLVGSYSTAGRNTVEADWIPFYSRTVTDAVAGNAPVVADTIHDEVYVGQFKDIRFQYTDSNVEVPTVFQVNIALNCHKATSKIVADEVLIDSSGPP